MKIFNLGRVALLASAIALASAVSANAAVLLSITGVVGDSHFFGGALTVDLSSFFEKTNPSAPGGLLAVTFNGPAITDSEDVAERFVNEDFFRCLILTGCDQKSDYSATGGITDFGLGGPDVKIPVGATSFTTIIDSSEIRTTTFVPGHVPYFTFFENDQRGVYLYHIRDFFSPDDAGKPYSLTVSTVPEPATWAMFLLGFGAVGFAIRRRRTSASTFTMHCLQEG